MHPVASALVASKILRSTPSRLHLLRLWLALAWLVVDVAAQTVTPPRLSGVAGGGTVDLGQRVVFAPLYIGSPGLVTWTFQWRKDGVDIPGATGGNLVLEAAVASDSGTYAVVATNSAGTSVGTTTLTVRPASAPVITTQPASIVSNVGSSATFSFSATGSFPRTQQWRKDGNPIAGATNTSLALTSLTTDSAGAYTVVVTNAFGSITSTPATLTVNAAIAPVLSPFSPSSTSITVGQRLNLGVSLNEGSPPYTYQWLKGGAPIAGATNATLDIAAVTTADAGTYSVIVRNAAGSATSREATVTVTPATPVSFSSSASTRTVYVGASFSISPSINGSTPQTYQWQKDGVAIPGATSSFFSLSAVALGDAGRYTLTATNAAGSATSPETTLVVVAASAPEITRQPSGVRVDFNGYFSLSVEATGAASFTYQWRKDGVAIPGATFSNYSQSSATPAASGVYTVVVTSSAGSTTSAGAPVTVAAATAPVIGAQPIDRQAVAGTAAYFSVSLSNAGTGELSYQWLKDGAPIPGATSTGYTINTTRESDAGAYSVYVTGAGGSVASKAARLTIVPTAAPAIERPTASVVTAAPGARGPLAASNNITGTPPLSYQWFRNGVAVAGATNASIDIASVAVTDYGTYTLTISNEAGSYTSMPVRLRPDTTVYEFNRAPLPWLDVGRVDDVVFFLATQPARIERYDLAAERWLPTVILSETLVPTAFVPTAEGVYLAYGRSLVRRSLDLSSETPLLNTTASITTLLAYGDFLYFNGTSNDSYSSGNYNTLNRSTLQPGPTTSAGYISYGLQNVVFAPSIGKGFGRTTGISPSDIMMFTVGADGRFGTVSDSPYHGDMPVGTSPRVFPGAQLVSDESGTVYRTRDLTYAGSFGEPLTDLAFRSDGTAVLLRGPLLATASAETFLETGRTSLTRAGLRLFTRNTDTFVFAAPVPGSTALTVTKVAAASFRAATPPLAVSLPSGRFSIDDAFLGENDLVHVFSRTLQGFVRWNPATRQFLPNLTLRDAPIRLFHQPGNRRALAVYPDGVVTEITLAATSTERVLFNLTHQVRAVTDLGDLVSVNIANSGNSGDKRVVFGASTGPRFNNVSLYEATGLAWQPASRRLYSTPAFSSGLQYEIIQANGALVTGTSNQGASSGGTVTPPIRFNVDGSLLASANGRVLNADLASVGSLANDITDATWIGNALYSIRAWEGQTQVQQWARGTYLTAGTLRVAGTPVRLLALASGRLLVVTNDRGFLALTLLNADLSSAAPLDARGLAGVYQATTGSGDTLTHTFLYVRPDGTGVLLVSTPASRLTLVADTVNLRAEGSFVTAARDLSGAASRTVHGAVNADGTFSVTIPSLNLTAAGSRSTGSSFWSYFLLPATNGGTGVSHAIIAPDGRGLLLAQTGSTVDAALLTTSTDGRTAGTSSSGTRFTLTLIPSSTGMVLSADRAPFASVSFAGLFDGALRTDRLANISTRGRIGSGEDAMIAGFVVDGAAARTVLLRAIGPALAGFGVTGTAPDPKLTVFRGANRIGESDNWSTEPGASGLVSATATVGGFPLPAGGRDAALLLTLDPGSYTAQVTPASGSGGIALVEVYDAGGLALSNAPRLINIATRGRVGADDDLLIAGIVVGGNGPKRVLVRGVGPTLGSFGVGGALVDPVLTILAGTQTIASNDNWGSPVGGGIASEVSLGAAAVGAFPLVPGSRDAALVLTLQPGAYTAQVSGKSGATGVALIEVYELAP
ncbi:MAG: immunoglobulin domain-containing protein [Verrucomicrobia bacterium]|nr:immunoglobulin domain-containing protein [Verrucomicrobiota bacterium]